jgi:DNA recombination protein RmuC
MLSFYSCLLLLIHGVSLGSSFFLVFAPKNKLEEKLIAFSSQFNQLKEQLLNDKTIFEKQLENSIIEKKPSNKKRQLAIQLSKRRLILRIYGTQQGTKKRSRKTSG